MRVLIVEDEAKMAGLIRRGLSREGMAVDLAGNGEDAVPRAEATEYDAIVLDVMLPGIDGFEVCRRLRASGVWAPILMLTARDSIRDRVAGLDTGADDYLTKPFSYAELLARLRALVRRGQSERPTELRVGELRLDPATRRVWRGETEIELSPKEFAVLETFMRRPGQVLSRFQLLEHAWDYEYENRSNVVDAYVRLLRRKIDRPFGIESIETVRGAGYRMRGDGKRERGAPNKEIDAGAERER
jgi:two-component system, OmpR family, response regulator